MTKLWEKCRRTLSIYRHPIAVRMFFLGFSSGLPLLLVLGTLSFWLREAGVDLKTIGFMSWAGLCWGLKWVWAPFVDRLPIPFFTRILGRRRAWLLLAQLLLVASLVAMALTDPAQHLRTMAFLAVATAFCSATQDVVLDAYRIESGGEKEQAAFLATYQTGYRLAMIWSGAGALAIAAMAESAGFSAAGSWRVAYLVMAASALVGPVTVLLSPEPKAPAAAEEAAPIPNAGDSFGKRLSCWIHVAVCRPFLDFFSRFGWWAAVILMLIATYRISDVVMGVMANPFYSDLGFSKEEVAAVSKIFGVIMTLAGAFVGGVVSVRIGVMRTLFLGAVLSAATNLLFAALAARGHDLAFLVMTVSADNLASGIASVAFLAYLSGLTNVAYSATQYALFSSVMLILPKFLAGFSGVAVETLGYGGFFTATACLGVPVLILVLAAGVARRRLGIDAPKAAGDLN